MTNRGRFAALAGVCLLALAAYVFYAKHRIATPSTRTVLPTDLPQAKEGTHPAKRVYFRYNAVDSHYGQVAWVENGHSGVPQFIPELTCDVVYIAAGRGLCMVADRGVVTTYTAKLFDAETHEILMTLPLNGVPSRCRVSADGKLAALTVFVSGHGYTTLDFSTQTLLIDTAEKKVIADVETFDAIKDGKTFRNADFNFWGVTFTPHAKEFYATLSTGGKHYLVKGDIAKRTTTVVHENVECPSLSPDATRVAYKKRYMVDGRVFWQLHVLDLATGKETQLSEKRSIDDQLEWLDDNNVLYSVASDAQGAAASTDVWVAAADGSRQPENIHRERLLTCSSALTLEPGRASNEPAQ